MRTKVMIDIDTQDMGVIMRLYEEGVVKKFVMAEIKQDVEQDPRQFAQDARNGHRPRLSHHKAVVPGMRITDCVVAIMQTEPEKSWYYQDVGTILYGDYGFSPQSASPALTSLAGNGYVLSEGGGHWALTTKGKLHNQSMLVEIKTRNDRQDTAS